MIFSNGQRDLDALWLHHSVAHAEQPIQGWVPRGELVDLRHFIVGQRTLCASDRQLLEPLKRAQRLFRCLLGRLS